MKRLIATVVVLVATTSLAVGSGGASVTTRSAARGASVSTATSSLGRILVDGRGRTLYLFEKDRRGRSACSGTCATYWPPLRTTGKPIAVRGAARSLLGVTRRADGTSQVTYGGHPLYLFLLDTKPGQTKGQDLHDFGAAWYVVSPAGKKIEES
jgi:predicted lipoprotein with Yx(FWY)xxD motif